MQSQLKEQIVHLELGYAALETAVADRMHELVKSTKELLSHGEDDKQELQMSLSKAEAELASLQSLKQQVSEYTVLHETSANVQKEQLKKIDSLQATNKKLQERVFQCTA